MKFIALITCIFCLIPLETVYAQNSPQLQNQSSTDNKAITSDEKRRAQDFATRFIQRLRATRDLRPLLREFFVSDLKKSGLADAFWSRSVNLNIPEGAELNEDELWEYYAVKFSVDYLSTLYVASKVPLESLDIEKPETLDVPSPQSITEYAKTIKLPDEKI